MNRRAAFLVPIIAVMLAFAACSTQTDLQAAAVAVEKQLAWVESAEPSAMVDADIRSGRWRFLGVCGYACVAPGVGSITAKRYYPSIPVQNIEGTADVLLSERHAALVRRASQIASEYNRLAILALIQRGASVCPAGANWDAAFRDLYFLARTLNPSLGEADFSLLATEPRFVLILPPRMLSPAVETAACAILRKHSLPSSTRVAVLGQHDAPEGEANVLCSGSVRSNKSIDTDGLSAGFSSLLSAGHLQR